MAFCVNCGAPHEESHRFCVNCGSPQPERPAPAANVTQADPGATVIRPRATEPADDTVIRPPTRPAAPAPPAQPAAPVQPLPAGWPPAVRESRRTRRLAWILAVVLVLLVAAGGAVLGSRIVGGSTETSADGDLVTEPSDDLDESPGPDEGDPTDPPTTEPEPELVCWTGDVAVDGGCPAITGFDGLSWVFPSLARQVSDCRPRNIAARPEMWTCDLTTSAGASVRVQYSQWRSRTALDAHYTGGAGADWTLVAPTAGMPAHLRLDYPTRTGLSKAALTFQTAPFSVTLYASNATERARGVKELISLRREAAVNRGGLER